MLFDLTLSFANLWDLSRELCHDFITKSTYTTSLSHFYTGSRLIHSTIKSCFSFWKYIFTNPLFPQRTWLSKKERERKRKESLSTNAHEFSSLQKKKRKVAMLPARKTEQDIRRKEIIHHLIHPDILVYDCMTWPSKDPLLDLAK